MNKILFNLLLLLGTVYMASCDGDKNEDPGSPIDKCGEVIPYIVMQEKTSNNLELAGFIWAQELENVYRIEVSSVRPIFGYKNGHTASFDVSGLNTGTHSNDEGESIPVWEIPFTVNQAGIDYIIKVRYICGNENYPMGASTDLFYNPGDLCDAAVYNEFFYQFPLLNNIEHTYNDPVSIRTFKIRFETHTPYINGVEGFFTFHNQKIKESFYELVDNNGGKLTDEMHLDWFYEQVFVDGNHIGDKSYLEESIELDKVLEGLTEEEIENLTSINFIIKSCEETIYTVTLPLNL